MVLNGLVFVEALDEVEYEDISWFFWAMKRIRLVEKLINERNETLRYIKILREN